MSVYQVVSLFGSKGVDLAQFEPEIIAKVAALVLGLGQYIKWK